MISRENVAFGASLLKELGLWGGAIASGVVGFLWVSPWLVVAFAGGRGHTSDWVENFLVLCGLVAIICFVAAVLFVIGAIRNTVGTGSSNETIVVAEDAGEFERM